MKYEEVYLKDYQDVRQARESLTAYFAFYNNERPHQALAYRTPAQMYFAGRRTSEEGRAAAPVRGRRLLDPCRDRLQIAHSLSLNVSCFSLPTRAHYLDS